MFCSINSQNISAANSHFMDILSAASVVHCTYFRNPASTYQRNGTFAPRWLTLISQMSDTSRQGYRYYLHAPGSRLTRVSSVEGLQPYSVTLTSLLRYLRHCDNNAASLTRLKQIQLFLWPLDYPYI